MKAVVQRVTRAEVRVGGEARGRCGRGLVVLLGVLRGDREEDAEKLAGRIARLRFFPDAEGRMNRSALEVGAEALVISQFTLAATGRRGRRPSFDRAAPPEVAEPIYQAFVHALGALGVPVQTGVFGAKMEVELVNDGPVTFALDEGGEKA